METCLFHRDRIFQEVALIGPNVDILSKFHLYLSFCSKALEVLYNICIGREKQKCKSFIRLTFLSIFSSRVLRQCTRRKGSPLTYETDRYTSIANSG